MIKNNDWKKIIDAISFNNSIDNIEEKIYYFKDKNHKLKKKYKKTLKTILELVDTTVTIGETSTSITLTIRGIGLNISPILAGIACALSLSEKVLHKMIIKKCKSYKNEYEKDQKTIKFSDKFYRESLQDKVIDKSEYESLCNHFTKFLDETKNESFLKT